jgi:hypothetical protein
VLPKLTDNDVAWTVKSDPTGKHHPETVHTAMRVEVILTTLAYHLNPAPNNVAAGELNDRLTTRHIRGLIVFENLVTTLNHDR